MNRALSEQTVLKLTPWCTVRQQDDQYLIYNSHTDELHLLPYTAYYVLNLCDGLASVSEIESGLGRVAASGRFEAIFQVRGFFAALLERGILEVDDDVRAA